MESLFRDTITVCANLESISQLHRDLCAKELNLPIKNTHTRLRWHLRQILAGTILCSIAWPSEPFPNPVVPNATLGEFRHGTFPSLGNKTHAGIDLVAPQGSPIYAFADGKVIDVNDSVGDMNMNSFGYMVLIWHPAPLLEKDCYTLYLHMNAPPTVSIGDRVVGGKTILGEVGCTGAAIGFHTHFEVRYFRTRLSTWGNLYGFGDQRESVYFKESWPDPIELLNKFPDGIHRDDISDNEYESKDVYEADITEVDQRQLLVVIADTLSIRKEASFSGEIVGKVKFGQRVTLTNFTLAKWPFVPIEASKISGWAHVEYLQAPEATLPGVAKRTPSDISNLSLTGRDFDGYVFLNFGGCPGEGCAYTTWKAISDVSLYPKPRRGTSPAFSVKVGEQVEAEIGIVATRKMGIVTAQSNVWIKNEEFRLGQQLEAVHYLGEGFWLLRKKGALYCADVDGKIFTLTQKPQTDWWVRVRMNDGQIGWTMQAESFRSIAW